MMITQIIKKITPIAVVIFVVGLAASAVAAQDKKEKQDKASQDKANLEATQEIEGEVSAVDKHGIAIVYNRDAVRGSESEIYIPLVKENIRIIHKRKIEEIQVGDIVKVEYETVTDEQKHSGFNVKTITFLKPAQNKPLPPEPIAEEEEPEGTPLPFKGTR